MKKIGAYLLKCLLCYVAFVVTAVLSEPAVGFLDALVKAEAFLLAMVIGELLALLIRKIAAASKKAKENKEEREADRAAQEEQKAAKKAEKEAKKAEKAAKKAEKEQNEQPAEEQQTQEEE
jgi:type VI protein secretion system component VasK